MEYATASFHNEFCAERFVQNLYERGSATTCDMSNKDFHRDEVPHFYNEEKFERGRKFFYKHYFSILICKVIALMVGLADPIFNRALQQTGKSSTAKTSFKRYKSTINHILLWYQEDFRPGTKSWKSLKNVKTLHNKSSQFICKEGLPRITQRDMAVTQLGFILVILIQNTVGIFGACKKDLEGFVHIWRNFGKVLGIQDEFNICRDSLEETTRICNVLFHSLFPVYIRRFAEHDYIKMATSFLIGFQNLFPMLKVDMMGLSIYLFINYRYPYYSLNRFEYDEEAKKSIKTTLNILKLFRFNVIRICFNGISRIIIWMTFKSKI